MENYINKTLRDYFKFPETYKFEYHPNKIIILSTLQNPTSVHTFRNYHETFLKSLKASLLYPVIEDTVRIEYFKQGFIISFDIYTYLTMVPRELLLEIINCITKKSDFESLIKSDPVLIRLYQDENFWKQLYYQNVKTPIIQEHYKYYYQKSKFDVKLRYFSPDPEDTVSGVKIISYDEKAHNVDKISAGNAISAYINKNGELYVIRDNKDIKVDSPKIKEISAGSTHLLCLDYNGNLYGYGDNRKGQLGLGHTFVYIDTLIPIPGTSGVKQISAGRNCSAFINFDGELYVFGTNFFGRLGLPNMFRLPIPTLVNLTYDVKYVSCGINSTVIIDTLGDVYISGKDPIGNTDYRVFTKIEGLTDIVKVSLRQFRIVFLDSIGKLWIWGLKSEQEWMIVKNTEFLVPTMILKDVADVELGRSISVVLYYNNTIRIYGGVRIEGTNNINGVRDISSKDKTLMFTQYI